MTDGLHLWELSITDPLFMIAGWRQWADAGSISSGLPRYLIDHLSATKIGEIDAHGFYLFQIPGAHHLMRPTIKLHDGYRQHIETKANEFYYAETEGAGLIIFIGDEPHADHQRYAQVFLDAVEQLGVKRVAAVGGVYGAMPYDREREVSCVYSQPEMKQELEQYAVKLSDYEGGSTIGTYLADQAEERNIELVVFYGFVPSYDFAQAAAHFSGIQVGKDLKAYYDLLRRLDHMFGLKLDLTELEKESELLISSIGAQIDQLAKTMPELNVQEYMEQVNDEFVERPFMPFRDLWEQELGGLFDDVDE